MEPAELALWTPVALSTEPPTPWIDWGDMRGVRFAEPFFDQTVARWAGGDPPPSLVRTDLDALHLLDDQPSLEPAALIFHLSRCGSTLLSRLLSRVPGTLVISEPAPINALLMAEADETAQAALLRLLVRALGRRRFGDERRLILKLSSWNICRHRLFRRAFPGVPVIWVQREPVEVMASLLAGASGWMQMQRAPLLAQALFGISADAVARLDRDVFCARSLAAMLKAAGEATSDRALVLDYRDLPDAAWSTVAAFLDLTIETDDLAVMRHEAGYYSKDPTPRPFQGDAPERRALRESLRDIAATELAPLYRELDARRRRAP